MMKLFVNDVRPATMQHECGHPRPLHSSLLYSATLLLTFACVASLSLATLPAARAQTQSESGNDFGGDINFDTEDMGFEEDGSLIMNEDPQAMADQAALEKAIYTGAGLICLFAWLVLAFVAYGLSDALKSVPQDSRKIAAWLPWLLLVPFANIVVLILAFIKVPQTLRSYLASRGDTSMGDCGESNGLWGSILYLLGCTFPIGLVLLVMSYLKIRQAKKIIQAG